MTRLLLGIETSCDETAAAVVADGTKVLSNVIASQIELHRRWRGVVPEVASRSHTSSILPVLREALEAAGTRPTDLAAVAVTHRPGMIGCLLVGLAAAKALSWRFDLPLVGVDHLLAHVHAPFMVEPGMPLPAVTLIASGGHTALYRVTAPGAATRIGSTRDDAAGEALDKAAALLGLPYPGGPSLQAAAKGGDAKRLALPRSQLGKDSLDFSFSGLKTSLLYALRGNALERPMPELSQQDVADYAASYQLAVVDILVAKLRSAARQTSARSLAIGGGVARNELLRARLAADPDLGTLRLVFPPLELCSDNGAMIAGLGTLLLERGQVSDLALDAVATSRPHPRSLAR
jgi:N6-L-threonylcarbamoyladenine synthase